MIFLFVDEVTTTKQLLSFFYEDVPKSVRFFYEDVSKSVSCRSW